MGLLQWDVNRAHVKSFIIILFDKTDWSLCCALQYMRLSFFLPYLPLWLKIPSISMLLREWAMQSMAHGTMPSRAGERSVVRTKHQSGLSWSRSSTSTVCPLRTLSSLLFPAMKSWITTVSSQPPDSWVTKRRKTHQVQKCVNTLQISAESEGWGGWVFTLSLSSVFWEVREAREMVSGWLLPSPWLSRSSPSLHGVTHRP